MRPGLKPGGARGAPLEDRAIEPLTVLGARDVMAGAMEEAEGGPRFPVYAFSGQT